MFKILGFSFALLLVALVAFLGNNFIYLQRVYSGSGIELVREVDWFSPKVEISPNLDADSLIRSQILENQDERFSEAISYAGQINSSAFLVYQGGELVVEKYWEPYGAENLTKTQSLHKSLLSMAFGIALEQGDINSVQDSVSDYLNNWIDLPLGDISLENLLTMSSGLGKEPARISLFDHSAQLFNSPDISKVAQSLPQKIAPGQEFEYINTNSQLLVDVLESATGQAYEHYLEEKIWSKLATESGYLWMDRAEGTPHGYCCLIATPEDLLRIGLLVLNNGYLNGQQIVPADWIDRAIAPSELNPNLAAPLIAICLFACSDNLLLATTSTCSCVRGLLLTVIILGGILEVSFLISDSALFKLTLIWSIVSAISFA